MALGEGVDAGEAEGVTVGTGESEGEATGDGAGVLGLTVAVTEGTGVDDVGAGEGVEDEQEIATNRDGIRIKMLIINRISNFIFFI